MLKAHPLCTSILHCLEASALSTLPKTKGKKTSLWEDCGSPTSGVLHLIKKSARQRYKHEARRLKRRQEHLERDKIGSALSQSKQRKFWKE